MKNKIILVLSLVFLVIFGFSVLAIDTNNNNNNNNNNLVDFSNKINNIELKKTGNIIIPDIDDDAILGDENALITMIEFGGYQDPYSEKFYSDTLPLIKEEFIDNGDVRFVFRDNPLTSIHYSGFFAAKAVECVGEQGNYYLMHDYLFDKYDQWATIDRDEAYHYFVKTGENFVEDILEYDNCMEFNETDEEVLNDMKDAQEAGISGSPAFFILNECGDYELLLGAGPYNWYADAIVELYEMCHGPILKNDLSLDISRINPENPIEYDSLTSTLIIKNRGLNDGEARINYHVEDLNGNNVFNGVICCLNLESGEQIIYDAYINSLIPGEYMIFANIEFIDENILDGDLNNNLDRLAFEIEENLCPSDFNLDLVVDNIDLQTIIDNWGEDIDRYDLDYSGIVDYQDLLRVLSEWGEC